MMERKEVEDDSKVISLGEGQIRMGMSQMLMFVYKRGRDGNVSPVEMPRRQMETGSEKCSHIPQDFRIGKFLHAS